MSRLLSTLRQAMVKLLLDQNLSAAAAQILRANGMDVVHAREVGLATAEDRDILIWCRENGRVLITLDADCHAILALSGATEPSVIRIRLEGLRDQALADLILRVVDSTSLDLGQGSAITVNATSIRVRRLPLHSH
jgi:predicted nuclease of predicted toxin-antitoxin system